ncbi:hypothetical protein H310_02074 [Aphanomyces invadans]|uniref:Dynein attachment factor N-terminal domain-containing protein n=1 Tax=Aphanomyces invadans TaxID=157072 RepID=A0A024UPP0_9STRA|nr:hypothetical protein H310_02074 [Aphanomyces invadans]ETW07598.1 hypothetical protein H310_02074 [Aphanomyces invadans]|eukprot:XP_008863691.1 hypothetical protein H310_02074 [Aphanomyces invadans]
MASIYEGAFDTAALQKELALALEEDRKYKLTDEMKKRAIHTAASYDDFRNFVLCADLKPVSSKELQNLSKSERKRNRMYQAKTAVVDTTKSKTLVGELDAAVPPATSVEFLRTWRRSCVTQDAKYKYLQVTTPERLQKLFHAELDSDLMLQIVACLNAQFVNLNPNNDVDDFETEHAHACFTLAMLEAATKTGRFALTVSFWTSSQATTVAQLVARVHDILVSNYDDDNDALGQVTVRLDALRDQFRQ